jgi:hypothetical protein
MELLNDRFVESVTDEDINVKREALTLLEGMLRLIPEERMTIKQVGRPPWPTYQRTARRNDEVGGLVSFTQVLSHPWLEAERANDPAPVNTEEEALLMTIPRPRGPPLQLRLQKHEYPYIRSVVEPVPDKHPNPALSVSRMLLC